MSSHYDHGMKRLGHPPLTISSRHVAPSASSTSTTSVSPIQPPHHHLRHNMTQSSYPSSTAPFLRPYSPYSSHILHRVRLDFLLLTISLLFLLLAAAISDTQAIDSITTATVNISGDPQPAQNGLPQPIIGTWIKLTPQASNETIGIPIGRCDHTFTALGGQSLRANARVPFPNNNQPPTSDPYADIIWLFGGHQNDEYKDSWFLDVSVSPPIWTQLSYSNPLSDVIARWGTPVSFIPNGLEAGDIGLTALLFSGYNNANTYVPEISSFNFASRTWRQVETLDAADSSKPFPRGYTDWFPLPLGYGTGNINQSVNSGDIFLLGGLGASDGINYGALDKDWSDQWIYNVTSTLWKRFGELQCTQNTTTCTDAESMDQFLAQMSIYFNSSATPVDMLAQLRPSEIYPQLNRILAGLNASAIGPSTLHDVPNACSTTCTQTETVPTYDPVTNATTSFTPAGIEGTRGVIVDGKLYEFGGYICADHGVQTSGGTDCFLGSMWVLDFATMEWTEIAPPDSDSIYAPYWPSKRAYNTIVALPEKKLIFVQGGAFQDSSSVLNYYNDQFVFDIALSQFVPLKIGGVPPDIAWSSGAALHGNDIYLHGGCVGTTFYDSLYVLRLGLTVEADNCDASGPGLTEATAGEEASFIIQVKERSYVTNPITNVTSLVFGANATYGTGLSFSAQLVSTDNGDVNFIKATVDEVGDGLYTVTYTAKAGRTFRLFIYLDDTQIPGSPFLMTLTPQTAPSAVRTTTQGYGSVMAAKGKITSSLVQVNDEYGNPFRNSTEWLPVRAGVFDGHWRSSVTGQNLTILAFTGSDTNSFSLAKQFSCNNNKNGSFTIFYETPSDYPTYMLSIQLNGQDIVDSPFLVVALDPIELSHATVSAFIALAVINIILCLCGSGVVHYHRGEAMMRASSPNFLHLLTFGSVLSSLSVIFLVQMDHDYGCQSFHSFLSIGLVMSLSALLAKSHRVEKIFNTRVLKVAGNLSDARLMIPTSAAILFMVLLNVLWIGINPMRSVARPSSASQYAAVLTFQTCSGENGTDWLIAVLVYCGVILMYGVYLAVQTGHVPEQFNESKVIAASIYNIFFCTIIVVPLLFFIGSNSDFLNGRIVIESIVILWSSLFNVLALIGPKLLLLYGHASHNLGDPQFNSTHKSVNLPVNSGMNSQTGAPGLQGHRGSVGLKRGSMGASNLLTGSGMPSAFPPMTKGSTAHRSGGDSPRFVEPTSYLNGSSAAGAPPSGLDLTQNTRYGRNGQSQPNKHLSLPKNSIVLHPPHSRRDSNDRTLRLSTDITGVPSPTTSPSHATQTGNGDNSSGSSGMVLPIRNHTPILPVAEVDTPPASHSSGGNSGQPSGNNSYIPTSPVQAPPPSIPTLPETPVAAHFGPFSTKGKPTPPSMKSSDSMKEGNEIELQPGTNMDDLNHDAGETLSDLQSPSLTNLNTPISTSPRLPGAIGVSSTPMISERGPSSAITSQCTSPSDMSEVIFDLPPTGRMIGSATTMVQPSSHRRPSPEPGMGRLPLSESSPASSTGVIIGGSTQPKVVGTRRIKIHLGAQSVMDQDSPRVNPH